MGYAVRDWPWSRPTLNGHAAGVQGGAAYETVHCPEVYEEPASILTFQQAFALACERANWTIAPRQQLILENIPRV